MPACVVFTCRSRFDRVFLYYFRGAVLFDIPLADIENFTGHTLSYVSTCPRVTRKVYVPEAIGDSCRRSADGMLEGEG